MIGQRATIEDINLNLEELVLPESLLCNESLSPDVEPEEEERHHYRIDTCCSHCESRIRLVVFATGSAISLLQQLLIAELSLLCPQCSRDPNRHGRPY
ncbi:E7 [Gammapapillomavirus sp.]|uniref:Protein E7 n=1 Tax=Human papillomavirus TaxID=10566 RepID=A0A385PMA7_9PAPI|nr:E7 [Gammapapillomavirus sp.]ATQ38195.1 E7 [Gammapapillomavirus sp.]AYA94233.1 MAG: E7 protein [Human papillomavirus]